MCIRDSRNAVQSCITIFYVYDNSIKEAENAS